MNLSELISTFNRIFSATTNTRLCGGFPEPLYQPATNGQPAEIRFTRDYVRSALHEIAHWCIAGEARRQQTDYGYWYRPDGRNPDEQNEFFRIEVKPQAIELAFSKVLGVDFQVSADNLNGMASAAAQVDNAGGSSSERHFAELVDRQLAEYERLGFPPRAQAFLDALKNSLQN